jgi:hypothetical protein
MRATSFRPKYTLTPDELTTLTKRLLASQPTPAQLRLVCYLVSGTDELSNLARHVEREVFQQQFELGDAKMHAMYGAHEDASIFFLVVDQVAAQPAGVIRNIRNGPSGLIALNDAREYLGVSVEAFKAYHGVRSLDDVWDIGSVVVRRGYRGQEHNLVSHMLFRAMHVRAGHEGIKHYVGIVDAHIRQMIELVGFWGGSICGSGVVSHEGSDDSMFSYGNRERIEKGILAKLNGGGRVRPMVDLFARRCMRGEGVDERLMFEFGGGGVEGEKGVERLRAKL